MATRESRQENGERVPFSPPVMLDGPLNTPGRPTTAVTLSPDWPASGSKAYFGQCAFPGCGGTHDIFEVTWHPDCNGNGEDDLGDIRDGASQDLDGNDIPDECDPPPEFIRGECNDDGTINIADAVCILTWLFDDGAAPGCVAATNTNGDGDANIADATYLLNHLFAGGPAPAQPFPECGAADLAGLGCVTSCR